jgi:signal transduction histidine kinase
MARATTPLKGRRFTIGSRLGASFASILLLFGAVLVVVLQALGAMADAEREVADLDRAKHAGHRVAALIREQYIHQAHTIIEGNRSHIDHYQEVAALTRVATEELAAFARSQQERELAGEIARLGRKNHDDFLNATLPAIDRGERDQVIRLHADTELVVGGVAKLVKELNGHFEAGSDRARARADRQRQRVRITVLTCFGAAAVLAAVLAALTTRSVARRVQVLREGAQRLGDGDLSRRISLEGSDELAELARSFDVMAARLEKHRTDLVQSQKLASIGRLCAGVAHEINGPLGIILGYAKVIRKQGADDEALGAIEDEAKQCQRIVQALLDMSRQDTPRFEPIDLAQLARDGIERLEATGAIGERRIVVAAPDGDVLAFGDEAKLRQVVLNLIGNAIDVTPAGGAIEVEVRRRKRRAILAIVDHGPGIPEEARSRLFEPFFTTKKHGTGLGLAIARAIVEAHRGEIRFDTPEGGGARIEVDLEEARQSGVEAFA